MLDGGFRKEGWFGLAVAAFWAVISIIYAPQKIIAQLEKKHGVYLIGSGHIGTASSGKKLCFILKHSRYNIIAASS
jgi:hypothetical protein